ncbi:uncharacterized protein LOC126835654 [Adelges cooleyi]|uniref:uncharacterized protein LOC126835654 n=1 Tax=Adelges cooleyi TaxID=133065 RepID=UPI00217F2620|nr:uncharacterized protein LOC126835654 [Adelges cooleyi]
MRRVSGPSALIVVWLVVFAAVVHSSSSSSVMYEMADLAFTRLVAHNCYEAYDPEKCNELSDMSAKDVRLYFGGMLPNDTVVAVLPDGDAQLTAKPRDAFLVLDPFPAYKFGHPMFMFYVDTAVDVRKCEDTEGIYSVLSDNTTVCMQMVRSRWCNERPMTSSWDCQVKFLPLVVPTRSARLQADNVLSCVDHKDTFLMNCPRIRDDGAELSDECNHLKTNTRGCDTGNFKCSTHKPTNQAVMLFGGWNRNTADFVTTYDLMSLKDRLVSWGFSVNNIRTFFANGLGMEIDDDGTEYSTTMSNVEPATKLNIRRYIKGICTAPRCADTFFLYLSSPTRRDGNALLWDANGNGIVESDEIYLAKEFLHDISHCTARRVVVFVDQSYSGMLPLHAQFSRRRIENVMIIPTTRMDDWTPRHSFNAYMREASRMACLSEYIKPFQESQIMPPVFTGIFMEQEMRNITISGVRPCVQR